ncbi:hypothetical protein QE454_000899 [Microbacterium sp. SORGH_AS454]|nr:hypothetical protein [Microbacterium sp. SORGH_AS_0454]MDR6097280.1 hypothetical protein [Microbacterium sp. SORGH_AS_0454]
MVRDVIRDAAAQVVEGLRRAAGRLDAHRVGVDAEAGHEGGHAGLRAREGLDDDVVGRDVDVPGGDPGGAVCGADTRGDILELVQRVLGRDRNGTGVRDEGAGGLAGRGGVDGAAALIDPRTGVGVAGDSRRIGREGGGVGLEAQDVLRAGDVGAEGFGHGIEQLRLGGGGGRGG